MLDISSLDLAAAQPTASGINLQYCVLQVHIRNSQRF